MTLPLDVANRMLALAWQPNGIDAMVEVLTPFVADRREALRLSVAWAPRELQPDDAAPSVLPTGEPVPSPSTPWPRAASPLPGVDLPVADVVALAWHALEEFCEIRISGIEVCASELARLVRPARIPIGTLERLAVRWVESGRAAACIRAAHPRSARDGWLVRGEIEELYAIAQQYARDWTERRLRSWRLLVRCGVEPREAWRSLGAWSPRSDVLPHGQWVPPEMLPPANAASATPETAAIVDASRTSARAALDDAIAGVVLDRPFHWALLASTRIVADPRVPTMTVGVTSSAKLALFFNPTFVLAVTPEERKGVLVHEINHVILGHLRHPPAIGKKRDVATARNDRVAWRLACECTANEYVPYALPGEPITIETLDLPPNEPTEARFARLRRRKKLVAEWASRFGDEAVDVIVRLLAAEPSGHDDIVEERVVGRHELETLLVAAARATGGEADPATRRLMSRPGFGAMTALQLFGTGRATLPWKALLRILARGLLARHATRAYPNRRQPDRVGVVPGKRVRREKPVVLAVIDTSGSMSSRELDEVSAELGGLVRQHARVACIQCDDEIRARSWLKTGARIERVYGRGGTDLRPPFHEREMRRYDPDLVVYFTDGSGPAPTRGPVGTQVLWVLTGDAPVVPARFGRVVRMRSISGERDAR